MATWKASIQINYDDDILFDNIEFEVPEDLYFEMNDHLRSGRPLFDWDSYSKIENVAKEAVDPTLLASGGKITNVYLQDPGDWNRLRDQFVGRVFPDWAYSSEDFKFEYSEDYSAILRVTVEFDGEGRILELSSVSAKAVDCKVIGTEKWGTVYPDFDYLSEALLEELGDEETEDDSLGDRSDEDYY